MPRQLAMGMDMAMAMGMGMDTLIVTATDMVLVPVKSRESRWPIKTAIASHSLQIFANAWRQPARTHDGSCRDSDVGD